MHACPRFLTPALLVAPALLLTACGGDGGSADASPKSGAIAVQAGDDSCKVARTDLSAGTSTFAIKNVGSQVTEVYVYAAGDRIVAEKENIGPGTGYSLTVDLEPGSYQVACKPGMTGNGIRTTITATASGPSAGSTTTPAAQQKAVTTYRAWVQKQADAAVPAVEKFAAAVRAGDVAKAKQLYAPSRVPWERIEPVAESFGDLDPRVDLREADLEPGATWTGWHRLEKALWQHNDLTGTTKVADQLVADVKELQRRVGTAPMSPASIGNGAKELLDEVATGKITGEEEAFSHTDLVDFAANVEGAHQAFDSLRPAVQANRADLIPTLDRRFADVEKALAEYRKGDTYVSYDKVPQADRRELARLVDALSEPLSHLAAAAAT